MSVESQLSRLAVCAEYGRHGTGSKRRAVPVKLEPSTQALPNTVINYHIWKHYLTLYVFFPGYYLVRRCLRVYSQTCYRSSTIIHDATIHDSPSQYTA